MSDEIKLMFNVAVVWRCTRCNTGRRLYQNLEHPDKIVGESKSLFCPNCHSSGWHQAVATEDIAPIDRPKELE